MTKQRGIYSLESSKDWEPPNLIEGNMSIIVCIPGGEEDRSAYYTFLAGQTPVDVHCLLGGEWKKEVEHCNIRPFLKSASQPFFRLIDSI